MSFFYSFKNLYTFLFSRKKIASKIRLLFKEEEAKLARSNKKVKDIHHIEYSGSSGERSPSHEMHSP